MCVCRVACVFVCGKCPCVPPGSPVASSLLSASSAAALAKLIGSVEFVPASAASLAVTIGAPTPTPDVPTPSVAPPVDTRSAPVIRTRGDPVVVSATSGGGPGLVEYSEEEEEEEDGDTKRRRTGDPA